MARKVNVRTVLNRKALDALRGGLVDGMADLGRTVIAKTRPPDAEPFGEGLVTEGDWGVWNDTRKVDGTASRPRGVRLQKDAISLYVGWGFPARFQEIGTIHQPPRPFFSPVIVEELPATSDHLKAPVRRALQQR